MFKPRTLLLYILLAWFVLGVFCLFYPSLVRAFKVVAGAIAVAAIIDGIWLASLSRKSNFNVKRKVNKNLPVYAWSEVTLSLSHTLKQSITLNIFDHHPSRMSVVGQPSKLVLPPKKRGRIYYRIKPLERGDTTFSGVDIIVTSPLTLWQKRIFKPVQSHVKIYPNFAQLTKYTLLATNNRLSQIGIRRRQRRGEGQDFRQLRSYRQGDSVKQIDWKATSRYQKLISREYQDERDQQVVFMLDCGRRMRHKTDGEDSLAHLDQTLNATLLLSLVATRQGDAAGFLSFAGQSKWVSPKKGASAVQRLLNQSYNLASTTEPADYIQTAKKLLSLQRKRALVVLITSTRDEDTKSLRTALSLLARKHLVVLADLKEPELESITSEDFFELDDALLYHSTLSHLQARKHTHDSLQHAGAIILDTTAKALPTHLVNTYLDIKQSSQL